VFQQAIERQRALLDKMNSRHSAPDDTTDREQALEVDLHRRRLLKAIIAGTVQSKKRIRSVSFRDQLDADLKLLRAELRSLGAIPLAVKYGLSRSAVDRRMHRGG
jgi:hypothetical protein